MKRLSLMLATVVLAGSAAFAAAPSRNAAIGEEARIPFANSRGIRDFQADGRSAVYIQDTFGRWYRGTFIGPCNDLPWASAIRLDTGGRSDLDRFGAIRVRGRRCALNSLVRVEGPPKRRRSG